MSVYQNSYSNIFILFNESKFLGQVLMSQRTNKNTPKIRKGSIKALCTSQFHLRPGPPRADPRELAFFLPWMANSRGLGTLELANPPGWGRKKRANAPSSVNSATFFIDRTVQ